MVLAPARMSDIPLIAQGKQYKEKESPLASPLHEACVDITCAVCCINLICLGTLMYIGVCVWSSYTSYRGHLYRSCLMYDEHCDTHMFGVKWLIGWYLSATHCWLWDQMICLNLPFLLYIGLLKLICHLFLYMHAFCILQYQLELVGTWLWWQVKLIPKVEVCTWMHVKKGKSCALG